MTKNRTPTPVYLDPGMHPGLEVKGLTCICKLVIAKVVAIRLFADLGIHNLSNPYLSAYIKYYSTEPVLQRLHNDVN